VAGRAVRDLSIRANPVPPGYQCYGIRGINMLIDGSVVDNVDILAPELPEERALVGDVLERGFSLAVLIDGDGSILSNSRISHQSSVSSRAGNHRIEHVRLEFSTMAIGSDAQVSDCDFVFALVNQGVAYAAPLVAVYGGNPTLARNYFGMGGRPIVDCLGGSRVTIVDNFFGAGGKNIFVRDGASAHVARNFIGSASTPILQVFDDAAPTTIFEENTFYGPAYGHILEINGPADFGGGPAGSRGQNHFGTLVLGGPYLLSWTMEWDLSAGGEIFARNNYWKDGRLPDQQINLGPTTTAHTEGAMRDPMTPEMARLRIMVERNRHRR